jgi:pre-mRNA-processing factor 17
MNVNITYDDMMLPIQGPENPYGARDRFINQNALAGHVEEQSMSDYAFRQQHLTHSIFGYSANPSIDPNAPTMVGSVEVAQANGFATLGLTKNSRSQKKAMKRKRKAAGNLEVVDGEDAYVGPWGSWEGDDAKETPVGGGDESEESEEESEEEQVVRKKGKPRRGVPGQEYSVFHGKSMTDYQGRTYMHPPIVEAPQLQSEAGSQESFLPKVCVHTWTGHTQGVSVIRVLPNTGHVFLSGSMDTKIKVSLAPRLTYDNS